MIRTRAHRSDEAHRNKSHKHSLIHHIFIFDRFVTLAFILLDAIVRLYLYNIHTFASAASTTMRRDELGKCATGATETATNKENDRTQSIAAAIAKMLYFSAASIGANSLSISLNPPK